MFILQGVGRARSPEEDEYQQVRKLRHKNKNDAGRTGWIKVRSLHTKFV
jgi:hypothetical protein